MKSIIRQESLSARERECLEQAAAGHVSSAIAQSLGLSSRTVDHHITSAMRKLRAPTRTAAAARLISIDTAGG